MVALSVPSVLRTLVIPAPLARLRMIAVLRMRPHPANSRFGEGLSIKESLSSRAYLLRENEKGVHRRMYTFLLCVFLETGQCKTKAASLPLLAFARNSSAVPLYNGFDNGEPQTASGGGVWRSGGGYGVGSVEQMRQSLLGNSDTVVDYRYLYL